MTTINLNKKSNICLIRLIGRMSDNQLADAKMRVRSALEILDANITIITDLSALVAVEPRFEYHIKDIQELIFRKGAKLVVRILGEEDVNQQFDKLQTESGAAYDTAYVNDLAEAMCLIESNKN